MAFRLKVSASFISAIETGKKTPPIGFEQAVATSYDLDLGAQEKLNRAADASRTAFMLSPTSPLGRDTAGLMARRMNGLSEAQLETIRNMLLKLKDGK